MAIDPGISLGIQPRQVQGPLQVAGQALTLRNLAQQGDIQQQQAEIQRQTIADNALTLAAKQREQSATQATAAALAKHTDPQGGTDFQAVANDLNAAGFPEHASKILDAATANQTHIEGLQQSRAAVIKSQNTLAARMALGVKWDDPTDVTAHLGVAVASGIMDPKMALHIQQAVAQDPSAGERIKQALLDAAPDVKEEIAKHAETEASTAEKVAATEKAKAETEQIRAGGNINWTLENVLLDGQPAVIQTNPRTGQSRDLNGRPIENAATRVRPLPTAQTPQTTVQQPQVDVTPPKGATANVPKPEFGGATAQAIHQNALVYALEGKLPSMGMGQNPAVQAKRDAIMNRGAALADAADTTLPMLQSEYRANQSTLTRLVPQYTAAANAANTTRDNLALASQQSANLPRTQAPLVNRYLQWAQGNLTGNPELIKFETYIYTAAREYAKVTSGASSSVAGLSDSAQKEASKLLNAAQNPEQFQAAIQAMTQDMENVLKNQTVALSKTAPNVAKFLAVANGQPVPSTEAAAPAGVVPPAGAKIRIFNPKTGKLE
jgi:hypothetical protein